MKKTLLKEERPVALLLFHPELSFEQLVLGVVVKRAFEQHGYAVLFAFARSADGDPDSGLRLHRGVGVHFPCASDEKGASEVFSESDPLARKVGEEWIGDNRPYEVRKLEADWDAFVELLAEPGARTAASDHVLIEQSERLIDAVSVQLNRMAA